MSQYNDTVSAIKAEDVTPANSELDVPFRALYHGGSSAGDIAVVMAGDATNTVVVFHNVPSGALLPIQVKQVRSTSTTATDIVGLI